MSNPFPFSLLLLAALFAGGCQGLPKKPSTPAPTHAAAQALPFQSRAKPPKEMDPDLVFDYLAGEIGAQQGVTSTAYRHLVRAARRAKDPVAAAQAAQLALRMNDAAKAAQAADLWVAYAPNSIQARELRMILALRSGEMNLALRQADAVLRIARALGKDGFLQLATALAAVKRDDKIQLMEKLAKAHPKEARAHYALALVASQRKRFALAERALDEASRLAPRWHEPYLLRARLLELQGKADEAEKSLRQALDAHPDATLFQALGEMLTRRKRYPEALEAFQQALKRQPKNTALLSTVGLLAVQTKQWDLARRTWQRLARDGTPEQRQDAWYFLGQVEELDGHPEKAIEYYKKVKEGRLLADARLRLAILEGRRGNLDEAARLFREIRLTNPRQAVQVYVTEAQLYKKQGHPERAMKVYDEAVAANPGNADLLYARGLLAADLGRVAQAERDLRAVLKLHPGDADALNALGYTLAEQTNRLKEAYGYISQALKKLPNSAAVLDSMGWVLYRMGRKEEALKYLEKAAAKLDDGEIAAHLGEVLWSLDRKEEARRVWRDALRFAPDNAKLKRAIERHR